MSLVIGALLLPILKMCSWRQHQFVLNPPPRSLKNLLQGCLRRSVQGTLRLSRRINLQTNPCLMMNFSLTSHSKRTSRSFAAQRLRSLCYLAPLPTLHPLQRNFLRQGLALFAFLRAPLLSPSRMLAVELLEPLMAKALHLGFLGNLMSRSLLTICHTSSSHLDLPAPFDSSKRNLAGASFAFVFVGLQFSSWLLR